MKVIIGYPPLKSKKGIPLLSQNRQFQWFKSPTYIYPVIPASAATLLAHYGHKVIWLDAIAENWTYNQWFKKLKSEKPDLLFIETKTPVIKQHWHIIKNLKREERTLPNLKIVLAGDHVTALPKESFKNCPVDHIIKGGHYDLELLSYINSRKKLNLNQLPFIDRKLTKHHLYAYKNGNFKYTPGAYTMAGRDCWWRKNGGCTFCSWTTLFPDFQVRTPENLLDEIGQLIKLGIKEVFDDTGTFPVGQWLHKFCQGMIKRGYHKKITFGCNMRFQALTKKDYELMAKANFRLLLFGLESANQKTLDKLNKGIKINKVKSELEIIQQVNKEVKNLPRARGGQLEPHITCMIGYPWESYKDSQKTIDFTKNLFKENLIDSLQATIIIPYPGTKLFKQAKKNNWLKTIDWNKYDMSQPVLKSPLTNIQIKQLTRSIYTSAITLKFILKKLLSIRSFADLKWFYNATFRLITHIFNFL